MWQFSGDGQQIGFKVSKRGVISAFGTASQYCRPLQGDLRIEERVKDASAGWSIFTPASDDIEFGFGGARLREFFTQNGDAKAVAEIRWTEHKAQKSVSLSILAPDKFAASAFTLLKAAMGNPVYHFDFKVSFVGLLEEQFSEFFDPDILRQRPHFSDEVTLDLYPSSLNVNIFSRL